jgi:hypothetical protein
MLWARFWTIWFKRGNKMGAMVRVLPHNPILTKTKYLSWESKLGWPTTKQWRPCSLKGNSICSLRAIYTKRAARVRIPFLTASTLILYNNSMRNHWVQALASSTGRKRNTRRSSKRRWRHWLTGSINNLAAQVTALLVKRRWQWSLRARKSAS